MEERPWGSPLGRIRLEAIHSPGRFSPIIEGVEFRPLIGQTWSGALRSPFWSFLDPFDMSIARTELAQQPPAALTPEVGAPSRGPAAQPSAHGSIPIPTRSEWNAAGLSLLFHLLLLLVLAALLIPVHRTSGGTSIDGGLGDEGGDGDLIDSTVIGTPDPGTAHDIEKSAVSTINAVPAVEGVMAGGAGSGSGKGHIDAVAALGAGGGGGGSGKGVGFFGTHTRADSVIFVVDMSGSMQGRRFNRAVEELIRSLSKMQPPQKFSIFFYNNVTHPLFEERQTRMVTATPGMRAKAIKWIKSLDPIGDTAPEEAIERALKMKPQVIYFLTDGEIPETTRDTAKRYNADKKTVIHTIAFEFEGGAEMLRGIAIDNRGKYRFVP